MGRLTLILLLLVLFGWEKAAMGYTFRPPSGYVFEWEIDHGAGEIKATMTAPTVGWVGFGWHCTNKPSCATDPKMQNVDFVVGLFDPKTGAFLTASDRVSQPGAVVGQPDLDTVIGGVENILTSSGSQNGTHTTVNWTRKLDTNDTVADWIINTTGITHIVYAWGTGNAFTYHGPNAFIDTLYFGKPPSNSSGHHGQNTRNLSYLRYWHATLMFFAYGLLFTLAILVARYLKHYDWWFEVHWGIIGTALCMILAAFVMIIIEIGNAGEPQFQTPHEIIGLITVILTFLTAGLGVTSHFIWNPDRTAPPIWPDQIHWWCGRITLILAWANIVIGMAMPDLGLSPALSWVTGGVWVYLLIVFFLVEFFRLRRRKNDNYELVQ